MVQESKLKILFLFSLKLAFVECCCVPDQWEGRLAIKFGEIEDGRLSAGWEFYNMSFDATNQKVAYVGHIGVDESEWYEQVLQDYSKGKQYAVKAGTCKITPLEGNVTTCIPSNAKMLLSSYFGFGQDKLSVNFYQFTLNQTSIEISVVNESCVPVTQHVETKTAVGEMHYIGVAAGISNKKIFDVPLSCQNQTQSSADTSIKWVDKRRNSFSSVWW
ncbi:uncharacterized protein [Mytilus edulis]|uniref:uncharacterized protein isoform X1 n=1 Tax=Mytilus edulis TaxID=6550 RepID=UPI0039F045B2